VDAEAPVVRDNKLLAVRLNQPGVIEGSARGQDPAALACGDDDVATACLWRR
jgi:hypothetical protein